MKKIKCSECEGEAKFFHSGCCGLHFEGVINKKGEWTVACEGCGKYVGHIVDMKKLKLIKEK